MNESPDKNAIKKDIEKYYLEKVKASYSDFSTGEIVPGEEPDFLVVNSDPLVGIEMVNYIRGQSSSGSLGRHYEKLNEFITNAAREEFERNYKIPLMVHFNWLLHRHPGRSEAKSLAVKIAHLIENFIPQGVYMTTRIGQEVLEESTLGDFIASIFITRMKPTMKGSWSNIEFDFVGLQPDEIQNIISSKEAKIDSYLQKCTAAWLIIVADGTHISSNVEIHSAAVQNIYSSRFERVLFYDAVSERLIVLNTHNRA